MRWKKKVRVEGMIGGPDGVHVGNFTQKRGVGLDHLGCWVAEATGR